MILVQKPFAKIYFFKWLNPETSEKSNSTAGWEVKTNQLFIDNHGDDMVEDEIEFDTPELGHWKGRK